jgi:hypothetical protein
VEPSANVPWPPLLEPLLPLLVPPPSPEPVKAPVLLLPPHPHTIANAKPTKITNLRRRSELMAFLLVSLFPAF